MTKILRHKSGEYYAAVHNIIYNNSNLNSVTNEDSECRLDGWYSKSAESLWWEDKELIVTLKDLFDRYLTDRRDRRIILRSIQTNKPCILPYTTRFDGDYPRRVKKALRGVHTKKGTLLTLTTDPKRFSNVLDATRALNEGWHRIQSQMKRHFGHLSYLCVTEFSPKNNLPHLHIILSDVSFDKSDIKWLRKLWNKHVAYQIDVEPIRNVNATNYVLKYLEKSFENDKVAVDGQGVWYWVTNTKFYSISEDLKPEPTENEIVSKVIADLGYMDEIELSIDGEEYEYIGVCYSESIKDPPKIMTDKWLLDNGWFHVVELGSCDYWESPDILDKVGGDDLVVLPPPTMVAVPGYVEESDMSADWLSLPVSDGAPGRRCL